MIARKSQIVPLTKDSNKMDFDEEEEKVSFRLILEKFLNSKYGKYFEILSGVTSLLSTIIFIISTYLQNGFLWQNTMDIAVCSIFLVEYLIKLTAA